MSAAVSIKDILKFLEENDFHFSFQGSEDDIINGISTLFNYQEKSMTFVSKQYRFKDYLHQFKNKKIQLIITDPSEDIFECFENVIQIEKPTNAFFSILDKFFNNNSEQDENNLIDKVNNVKRYSYISENANIGENVKIGRGCVIEGNVNIGDNTEIHHNVVIRSKTRIGKNCTIYSGTVIGERGFNPNTQADGSRLMLNHYGGVVIEDNVHIGDNCSISKGTIDDTVIKKGVKLNTMIRVAHNCVIGENTVVTMPTFICGSVTIGKNCHIAANVIRNQCKIGDNATLGLGSVVVKDVEAGDIVIGNPARSMNK